MPDLTLASLLLAIFIMALGTAVQAALGFGLALVAAPLLHLIDPMLVPGPVILCVWTLSLWVLWQEHEALDTTQLGNILVGRFVGAVLATLIIGSVSTATFDILFGILVLLAVGMSILHPNMQATPRAVFIATLASGFMGTLSGIGGPPLALVYQNAHIRRLRAILALIFLFGASMSMCLLALVGKFGLQEILAGLWLQLGVAGGILLGQPLRRHLAQQSVRPILLALCSIAALIILIRAQMHLA
jgi:uncharacterized protein